jgi:hypothetical protein
VKYRLILPAGRFKGISERGEHTLRQLEARRTSSRRFQDHGARQAFQAVYGNADPLLFIPSARIILLGINGALLGPWRRDRMALQKLET